MKKHDEEVGLKALIRDFKTESKETCQSFKESFSLSRLSNAWLTIKDGYAATMFEVNQASVAPQKGNFKGLRTLNRKRIYFSRYMKRTFYYAWFKFKWDLPKRIDFDPTTVKSVLLLQHINALGDLIVETGLIKCLHRAGIAVDLIVTHPVKTLLEGNPYVRNLYVVDPVTHPDYIYKHTFSLPSDIVANIINNQYDLMIDTNTIVYPLHIFPMLNQLNAKAVLGFNRWPSVNYYVKSLEIDVRTTHASQNAVLVADYLQIDNTDADKYDLYIPENIEKEAQQYLAGFHRRTLLINIFASHSDRCLTMAQLNELIKGIQQQYPDIHIVLLDHKREVTIPLPDRVTINPFTTLHHCMGLIKHADAILSVDTAIVHMARAWQKPLLGIYRQGLTNNVLWAPGYPEAIQLIVSGEPITKQPDLVEKVLKEVPALLG